MEAAALVENSRTVDELESYFKAYTDLPREVVLKHDLLENFGDAINVDKSVFQTEQANLLPPRSTRFERVDGDPLDVDRYLADAPQVVAERPEVLLTEEAPPARDRRRAIQHSFYGCRDSSKRAAVSGRV